MIKSIFKSILVGVLLGALLFFAFRIVIVVLIIGALVRLLSGRRRGAHYMSHRMAYVDSLRNMGDEEYQSYKNNMGKHCMHPNMKPTK